MFTFVNILLFYTAPEPANLLPRDPRFTLSKVVVFHVVIIRFMFLRGCMPPNSVFPK